MDILRRLEKVLRVEKGSRVNRTGTHFSARPRPPRVSVRFLAKKQGISKSCVNKNVLEGLKWVYQRTEIVTSFCWPKTRLKEDGPVRLHVNRCAQTPVWTSSRILTNYTFSEHGMSGNTGLFAEPDGDEVKNFLWKNFQ